MDVLSSMPFFKLSSACKTTLALCMVALDVSRPENVYTADKCVNFKFAKILQGWSRDKFKSRVIVISGDHFKLTCKESFLKSGNL